MAMKRTEIVSKFFGRREAPPRSFVFSYQKELDDYDIELLMSNKRTAEYYKREMAHSLANKIMEECQLFQMPDYFKGIPIRAEITINDRGSYENYLETAKYNAKQEGRKEGKAQGIAQVLSAIPYGFEVCEYYE